MIVAHKIALDPTDSQRRYFTKAAGCDRFVWNLAVAEWQRRYEAGEHANWMEIKKDFNAFKYEAFPWMKELHRDAHADALERVGKAWSAYFKNPKQTGRPTFHKKGRKDSFYVACDKLTVSADRVRLPVIGWVRVREALRYNGKIQGATVSRTADRWFVAIQVDVPDEKAKKQRIGNEMVGVDLGINSALALSTGKKIDAPKPLKKALKKLRKTNRKLARQKEVCGKNFQKTKKKLGRIHAQVANIRKDFWHKISTRICRENQAIAIEDLNVKGMMQNRKLARALADVAIGMIKPMLKYKSKIYDSQLVITNRWFASSKTCSNCRHFKEKLELSERIYHCEKCGLKIDRDVNAAINEKSQIPTACGESMSADRAPVRSCEAETLRPCIRQARATMSLTAHVRAL